MASGILILITRTRDALRLDISGCLIEVSTRFTPCQRLTRSLTVLRGALEFARGAWATRLPRRRGRSRYVLACFTQRLRETVRVALI